MLYQFKSLIFLISVFIFSWGCTEDESDTETTEGEAGSVIEAGSETGTSSGTEAGTSSGAEAGTSSGEEAGAESGAEAGASSGVEAGVEAGTESGAEGGASSGAEAGAEGGVEGGVEGGAEAGAEGGTDLPPQNCVDYCDLMNTNCDSVFEDDEECVEQCARYPLAGGNVDNVNTFDLEAVIEVDIQTSLLQL